MVTALLWFSAAAITSIYVGYPLVLAIASLFTRTRRAPEIYEPSVTVIIAAHNEEATIDAVIRNKLASDYPAGKIEIIVVSDASTDRTEEIVRRHVGSPVRLAVQDKRKGKTAAMNAGAQLATGEVLVFSDANSMYLPQSIHHLVRHFADPTVGYVTGRMMYLQPKRSAVEMGCSLYMMYEHMLRSLESRFGRIIGVCGGIDAMRRRSFQPVRDELMADLFLPLRLMSEGLRVIYEPRAILIEPALNRGREEWKMRVRVIVSTYHVLWDMRGLMNPFRHGVAALQLLFHKPLRYSVGLWQICLFATTVARWEGSPFFEGLLGVQVGFYLAAFIGFLGEAAGRNVRVFSPAFYLCLLNLASIAAFFQFVGGRRFVTWAPRTS